MRLRRPTAIIPLVKSERTTLDGADQRGDMLQNHRRQRSQARDVELTQAAEQAPVIAVDWNDGPTWDQIDAAGCRGYSPVSAGPGAVVCDGRGDPLANRDREEAVGRVTRGTAAPMRTWTAAEVAEQLHQCKKSVRRLELRGRLRRVPGVCRPVLYTDASVAALLNAAVPPLVARRRLARGRNARG